MRKEVIVAISLGIILGLAIAFGVWRANLSLSGKTPNPQVFNSTQEPTQDLIKSSLVVTNPENLSVSSQEELEIKGTAEPKALIIILTNEEEQILEAKQDGSFEASVLLVGGPNEIIVKSYSNEGEQAEQKLTIVYSTEFVE